MARGKWAMVIAALCVVAMVIAVAYNIFLDAPVNTYTVRAHCRNCDWEGKVEVLEGESVDTAGCPRCKKWMPPRPVAHGKSPAEQGAAAAMLVGWRLSRRSMLVTRDNWEMIGGE